jgi:anti-sigma regulatory factor (Ser/Thr protein kinase)
VPATVRQLRAHVGAFTAAAGAPHELQDAVALAVSETVTNAVVHAYAGARETGTVRVRCWVADGQLVVEVADGGAGMARRDDSPGVGHGLAMVGAVAEALDIAPGPDGRGTAVTMTFAAARAPEPAPGLEALCRLALDTVADVSCVDLVRGGVLRRVAGEVAGDAGLTAWLRNATPPAKPGTATWAALRDRGPQFVVHDPAVPRSPGGAGEILGLEWWVSVPLSGSDGAPAALWGLGGRAGGRPAPADAILDMLGDAARADLADATRRAALRERLGAAD